MLIALDIDGTYSRAPELFDIFVRHARDRGYEVVVATMRYPHENCELTARLQAQGLRIVYTSRIAKAKHLASVGLRPDIWIDDRPEFIMLSEGDLVI